MVVERKVDASNEQHQMDVMVVVVIRNTLKSFR